MGEMAEDSFSQADYDRDFDEKMGLGDFAEELPHEGQYCLKKGVAVDKQKIDCESCRKKVLDDLSDRASEHENIAEEQRERVRELRMHWGME